jgi:hypothetical protein
VASPTPSTQDAAFDDLCLPLQILPRQRSLADDLKIGRLIDELRRAAADSDDDRRSPYGTRWAESLVEQLAARGIALSPTLAYRYRRLGTFPDRAFQRLCRKARRARWEEVMRLLPIRDPALRRDLLSALGDQDGGTRLSARAFRDLVRLAAQCQAFNFEGVCRNRPNPIGLVGRPPSSRVF